MLPTEKASKLHLWEAGYGTKDYLLYTNEETKDKENTIPQHLYIISDEEIKIGDYVFHSKGTSSILKYEGGSHDLRDYEWKKVIASTDKSLLTNKGLDSFSGKPNTIPQIPESFIKDYIKVYNEGKPITEVDLEVQYVCCCDGIVDIDHLEKCNRIPCGGVRNALQIKTNPNSTVIIHQSKTYTKQEVELLCRDAFQAGGIYCATEGKIYPRSKGIDNWIKDNLK